MTPGSLAEKRFAEADAEAEKLLGYVRMGVAVLLATSILMAALSGDRPHDTILSRRLVFAMIGMSAYFLVGLITIILVKAGRYGPWIAWITAFIDISLILWNVFGGVYFGGVDPLYALALPAAFVVPLVLTFGALRFRPEIQIAATIYAVVIIGLIVFSTPAPGLNPLGSLHQVTISYGAPPNAIRIVIMLALGLIVALSVWRARRLLERVLAEAEARANLTRFLPEGVAEDMTDEAVARLRTGRRAKVGVLFIDIRGFTAMADGLAPEAASAILTGYRAVVLDVASAHGGVVDKFIGDGALVLFGLQGDAAAGARGSLDAAAALARRFDGGNYRIGIGVHFGEVMIGAVGDERRLEFTVIGDVVNLASRIEQMTKEVGETALASADTIEASGAASGSKIGAWVPVGEWAVRGRDAPVEIMAFRS